MHRAALAARQSRRGKRLGRVLGPRRLIQLIQQIHVLILTKDMRHVGDILLPITHQQVRRVLGSVRRPLACQHN